jgi:hypothetical protein
MLLCSAVVEFKLPCLSSTLGYFVGRAIEGRYSCDTSLILILTVTMKLVSPISLLERPDQTSHGDKACKTVS